MSWGGARKKENNSNINSYLNTVEDWEEKTSTWKVADDLAYIKCYFGAVEMAKDVICSS